MPRVWIQRVLKHAVTLRRMYQRGAPRCAPDFWLNWHNLPLLDIETGLVYSNF